MKLLPTNKGKLIPNMEAEPNFYRIGKLFPLPPPMTAPTEKEAESSFAASQEHSLDYHAGQNHFSSAPGAYGPPPPFYAAPYEYSSQMGGYSHYPPQPQMDPYSHYPPQPRMDPYSHYPLQPQMDAYSHLPSQSQMAGYSHNLPQYPMHNGNQLYEYKQYHQRPPQGEQNTNTDCQQPFIVRSPEKSLERATEICVDMMKRMGVRAGPCPDAVKQLNTLKDNFARLFPLLYKVVLKKCTCDEKGQHVYMTRPMFGDIATKPGVYTLKVPEGSNKGRLKTG
jgi:hypothetical protein